MSTKDGFGVEWPARPDGSEVPAYRRSWYAHTMGYPVFCASDWTRVEASDGGVLGSWMCGYCEGFSTDQLSPRQGQTVANCTECGKPNRISLD